MPEFFTAEEVKKKPFLFVSYSHTNKELTDSLARFLLDEGVRLWYDADLAPGDKWSEKVADLITHQNCHGVIFVCSPAAFCSENVHKEREATLEAIGNKKDDSFCIFTVNVCDNVETGSYMSLLKQTFDQLQVDTISKMFPIDRFYTLMHIIGNDPIDVKTADCECFAKLLSGINKSSKEVMDKASVALESLQKSAGTAGISFVLGDYDGPLKWQLVSVEGDNGVFILQKLLEDDYGKGLGAWLNNDFRNIAFSEAQAGMLVDSIRLLTVKESEKLSKKDLQAGKAWWLQDSNGNRQAEITAEGTVSSIRQLNHRFKRGVRPVITVNWENANNLVNGK